MTSLNPTPGNDRSTRLALIGVLAGAVAFLLVMVCVCVWVVRMFLNSHGQVVQIGATKIPGVTIGGVVVDDQGQPISDARVHLNSGGARPGTRDPHTDPQGRWKLDAIANQALNNPEFTVTATDFSKSDIRVMGADLAKLKTGAATFVMHRGVDVSGKVVDSGGAAIAGAYVTSRDAWQSKGDASPHATSDANGNFTLNNLPPEKATITATAPGMAPQLVQTDVFKGVSPLKLVMSPGRTIRGRVVDMDNQPISGASVIMTGWHGVRPVNLRADTNDQGDFQIEHAPADAFTVAAQKDEFNRDTIQFNALRMQFTFTLSRLISVSGKVVDAKTHKPVQNFRIITGARRAALEPLLYAPGQAQQFGNGRYQTQLNGFAGQVDAWAMRIEARGYITAESGPLLQSGPRDFALVPGKDFVGRVLDPSGKPQNGAKVIEVLPGQTLTLANENPTWNRGQTIAGADGTFGSPPPADNAIIIALGPDGFARANHAAILLSHDLHEIPFGSLDVFFAPGGKGSRRQVRLLLSQSAGDDSQPAQICQTFMAQTNAQGRVHLDHVLPGEITVTDLSARGVGATTEPVAKSVTVTPAGTASVTID